MASIDPQLYAFFERSAADLESDGWQSEQLAAGAGFWRKDEAADSVAYVRSGTLSITVDGNEVGRVIAGELLGEASAFLPNERRSADVGAAETTHLWILRRARLSHLRVNNVAFYDMILKVAIATVAQRIGENDRQLSMRKDGKPRPKPASPSLWTRFRRQLERPDEPPPVTEALEALPNLPRKGLLTNDIGAIAEPLWLKTGEALCLQGDPATSMYIVARGALQVMLAEKTPVELGRCGAGALLGTAALLHDCDRSASLIAAEPTWVYELTRERVATLSAGAWRILAESLLAAMREQLVHSHRR